MSLLAHGHRAVGFSFWIDFFMLLGLCFHPALYFRFSIHADISWCTNRIWELTPFLPSSKCPHANIEQIQYVFSWYEIHVSGPFNCWLRKCGSDCKIFALDNCRLNRIHQGGTSSQADNLVQPLSMLITRRCDLYKKNFIQVFVMEQFYGILWESIVIYQISWDFEHNPPKHPKRFSVYPSIVLFGKQQRSP